MGIPSPAASWGGKQVQHVTNERQQRPKFSNGRGQRSDLDVSEPGFDGPEALLHRDVVHHHHAVRLAEELLGDAAVPAATRASFSTNSDTPGDFISGFQRTSPGQLCPTAAWPPACCPASVSSHCNQYLIQVNIIK